MAQMIRTRAAIRIQYMKFSLEKSNAALFPDRGCMGFSAQSAYIKFYVKERGVK
jgi:hypothetical protein